MSSVQKYSSAIAYNCIAGAHSHLHRLENIAKTILIAENQLIYYSVKI